MEKITYGFIGLGHMGKPMARCLAQAGLDLIVHNRTRSKAEDLVEDGARIAETAVEVAQQADIVFTCLLYPHQVEEVYFGEGGLIEGARAGQVFCDTSTVEPSTIRNLYERLREYGISFLDGPISGGIPAAENGRLSIMVGGDRNAYDRALQGLSAMGDKLFYMGPSGSGSTMKLVNQLLVCAGEALAAEAMVLGTKAGLNAQRMYDVVEVSSGNSVAFNRVMKGFVLERNFEPSATVNLIAKDLDCILRTASEVGVRTLMGAQARQAFLEAQGLGYGERDLSSVILPLEKLTGVVVGVNDEGI